MYHNTTESLPEYTSALTYFYYFAIDVEETYQSVMKIIGVDLGGMPANALILIMSVLCVNAKSTKNARGASLRIHITYDSLRNNSLMFK